MRIFSERVLQSVCVLAVLCILAGFSIAQDPAKSYANAKIDGDQAWESLRLAQDAVYQHHFAAPSRQQMYLAATRLVYRLNGVTPSYKLAQEFSAATDSKAFKELFLRAWNEMESKSGFDPELTRNTAVNGMLRCSDFKSGHFLSSKEYQVADSLKENRYVGIGIQLATHKGLPMISRAFYGGAAQKAGAKPNDIIVEVDGVQSEGRSLRQVVDDLRGPEGTEVVVKLQNLGNARVREYTMVRTTIPLPTVEGTARNDDGSWTLTVADDPGIAYLKFSSIVGSTSAEFRTLAGQIEREGFDRVILDFRAVRLSEIHHAIMLADSLLDSHDLGQIEYRDDVEEIKTRPGALLADSRLVVLSQAEVDGPLFFLLSNLKNRKNVTFVGQQVRSAGVATTLVELPEGYGAVQNLPCAICRPAKVEGFDPGHPDNAVTATPRMFGQPRFAFWADVMTSQSHQALLQKAVRTLQSEVSSPNRGR